MSWARYVTGWTQVKVTGAAPERVLYALAERGITFWDAAPPRDYSLTVRIPARTEKLIGPLAASLGCEAAVQSRHGIPALVWKLRRRYLIWGLLVLVLGLLYVGSAFIWEIRVTGNDTVPTGVIRQALSACGVDIGTYWPGLSQDAVRNGVLLRVDGIRWMTVTVRGGHAKVIVRESREHLPVIRDDELVKIVADRAGIVEKAEAKRGTAVVQPGQTVLPGDELIGAYTTGRFWVQGPARAIGPVTARTWYELTARAPVRWAEKVPAGGRRSQWALILGKTRIKFYKDSSICPAGCDKITVEHVLAWPGLFSLPVTLERTVYSAYEERPAVLSEQREDMERQLMDTLHSSIGPDGEVLSSGFTASERDGALSVTLRAECRQQIGREAPLTPEDLLAIQEKIPTAEERHPW